MTLWDLHENQDALIEDLTTDFSAAYVQRLNDWGFTRGAMVRCLKKTPFGGPRVFQVPGGVFTLEKQAAQLIKVQQ